MGQVAEVIHQDQRERWTRLVDDEVADIAMRSQTAGLHRELLAQGKPLPPGVKVAARYPTCSDVADVRAVAKTLASSLPDVMTMDDLELVSEDRWGGLWVSPDQVARTMLEEESEFSRWPEFALLVSAQELRPPGAAPMISWLWVPGMFTDGDDLVRRTVGGRVSVTNKLERGERDDQAPLFRVEVSLPWWCLAHDDERRAEVHRLLCFMGLKDDGSPYKRKPHLVAHAAHVARWGAPRDPMGAKVVAHLVKHPTTKDRLLRFGCDPKTGQGLLWSPAAPSDPGLDARLTALEAEVSS